MKFCYVDESMQGDDEGKQGDITVVVGILIDAQRLHKSRKEWKDLLISELGISELEYPNKSYEIKGSDLYKRRGYWKKYNWNWERRKQLIDRFIEWTVERKHKITFGAVSESKLEENMNEAKRLGLNGLKSWDIAARHLILGVQKSQHKKKSNKGNTILVFDHAKGESKLLDFVLDPPEVTEQFYNKAPKSPPLDQIVDVPFFVDSRHVGFIHLADLFAYIICHFAGISEGIIAKKYEGELDQLKSWMDKMNGILPNTMEMEHGSPRSFEEEKMKSIFLPNSMRWPQRSNDDFTKFLRSVAPESLLRVA